MNETKWWQNVLGWMMAVPFIVFFWSVALASVVLTCGGAGGIVVKGVGADIPWTWGELLMGLVAGSCLWWLAKVMAHSAEGEP
jgi:hypothetical protein